MTLAAAFGTVGPGAKAYFDYVNAKGGVNGRRIEYRFYDDAYDPAKTVQLGGKAYLLGYVCKAHDCGDNQLFVLFAPAGKQAWGLLLTGGSNEQWLGKPDASIQAAIKSNKD